MECSGEESVEFCSKSLKTLRESVRKSNDEVDASSYLTTSQTLAESCSVFFSLVSEFTNELTNPCTCVNLISLMETIITCLLKVIRDVKSVELVEQLFDDMEKLIGQLSDHTSVDLELVAALKKTVVDIRGCLPLCQGFLTSLQTLNEYRAVLINPNESVKEVNLIDAISSIYATIPAFLNVSEKPLQESETALTKFTCSIQSVLSISIRKKSLSLVGFNQLHFKLSLTYFTHV